MSHRRHGMLAIIGVSIVLLILSLAGVAEGFCTGSHRWDGGTVTKPATCVAAGKRVYRCLDCGATRDETIEQTNAHVFGKWVNNGDNTHSRSCTLCPAVENGYHAADRTAGRVTREATCRTKGAVEYTCTVCNAVLREELPLDPNHHERLGKSTPYNADYHSAKCDACGQDVLNRHVSDGGREVQKATCVANGMRTFTCTLCGATKDESLPKNPENHDRSTWTAWTSISASTHQTHCGCGIAVSEAHAMTQTKVITQASCQGDGESMYTCAQCGYAETRVIPATDHAYSPWTYVDRNIHRRICAYCDHAETAAHTWAHYRIDQPPTATEAGHGLNRCRTCKTNLGYTIPALQPGGTTTPSATDSTGDGPTTGSTPLPTGKGVKIKSQQLDYEGKTSYSLAFDAGGSVTCTLLDGGEITLRNTSLGEATAVLDADNRLCGLVLSRGRYILTPSEGVCAIESLSLLDQVYLTVAMEEDTDEVNLHDLNGSRVTLSRESIGNGMFRTFVTAAAETDGLQSGQSIAYVASQDTVTFIKSGKTAFSISNAFTMSDLRMLSWQLDTVAKRMVMKVSPASTGGQNLNFELYRDGALLEAAVADETATLSYAGTTATQEIMGQVRFADDVVLSTTRYHISGDQVVPMPDDEPDAGTPATLPDVRSTTETVIKGDDVPAAGRAYTVVREEATIAVMRYGSTITLELIVLKAPYHVDYIRMYQEMEDGTTRISATTEKSASIACLPGKSNVYAYIRLGGEAGMDSVLIEIDLNESTMS